MKEGVRLEDYEEEMRDIALSLVSFMEKVSLVYYTIGFLEGKNLNKSEENMVREKKSAKKAKVHKVLSEFKEKTLHSGSKKGPQVKSKKQAVAIAMKESGQSKKKGKK